jgi:hypothetical protein
MADDETVNKIQADDGTTWVEIASVGNEDEANLIRGFLDAEGIAAQIENVKFTEAPTTFGAMGDIRVYVAEEDEARALELLRKRNEEWDRMDDDGETVVTDDGEASIADDSETENEA